MALINYRTGPNEEESEPKQSRAAYASGVKFSRKEDTWREEDR